MNDYVCPACRHSLEERPGTYTCNHCKAVFKVTENIPVFMTTNAPYWGELSKERMKELNEKIQSTADLSSPLSSVENTSFISRVKDDKTADWCHLIPIGNDATVLDAGCGLGGVSFNLSRYYAHVFAVEPVFERIYFAELSRVKRNIGNVTTVCGSVLQLPFPDNTFDMAALNGVLEWSALADPARPAYGVQMNALKELQRVIKPGGYLYIGIENRYGIDYFLGIKDPHSSLRFAPILPRFLADIYSRLVNKTDYRTLTHSYSGYNRMLRHSGFHSAEFYFPLSNYRTFQYIVPLNNSGALRYFLESVLPQKLIFSSSLIKLLYLCIILMIRLRLASAFKWFVPSYSVIARKNA
jgi:SAM-dependent methyltransferase